MPPRLFLALVALVPACARPPASETLMIRAYTVAEGLAHDHINRIYRDSHGFLWICTDEGLSRFDGLRFVNYTIADGLPHIHVNAIIEARSGDYWIATDGGLTWFQPANERSRFTSFRPDGPPETLFVNALCEEADGSILIGTYAGLYQFHPRSRTFQRIEFPAPAGVLEGLAVHAIQMDGNGSFWIGTSAGLYRRDPKGAWVRITVREGLPHDFVGGIVADPEGRIWVSTALGLARVASLTPAGQRAVDLTITVANGLPYNETRSILFAPDGRRWIATHAGLVEWLAGPPMPENFRIYTVRDGLTSDQINEAATDVAGNLWIGTRRAGLMRVASTSFQTFGSSSGLSPSATDQVIARTGGGICVAGIEDPRRALRCLEGERFRATYPRLPAAATRERPSPSHAAMFDHLGAWWLSTAGGVLRFPQDPFGRTAGTPDLSLTPGGESSLLFEDSRGDVWIPTLVRPRFGLMRWRRSDSRLEDSRDLPESVQRQGVTALAEVPDGVLWLGLNRPGGLLRLRGGRFEQVDGGPPGKIQAMYRDRAGRLWIASAEGGLGRIESPESDRVAVRRYGRSDGLASNEIWCLTEDRSGYIYAGTVRGVDRIDPATGSVRHLSAAGGLVAGDIRSAHSDANGDLWFLSNQGLSRFHPGEDARPSPPVARITSIRVAGAAEAVSAIGQREVAAADYPWNRNSIQIDFSALSFETVELPRYQFRLLGGQEDWSDPSAESSVHIANLAPGAYRFLVRAVAIDGTQGEPASFAFHITPPPWLRWWFQTGLAALALTIGYAAHRVRLERQLALQRVRSHIATDLHDDIGATLSRIAAMSEAVRSRVGTADSDSQKMLTAISEGAREAVGAMSDIVWAIDPRRDELGDVVARIRAFGSEVLEPRGIRWTCEGSPESLDRSLALDQRRQFYLICKEAIHNIARHSQARTVSLRIGVADREVTCEIEDDGRGIAAADRCGGAGLGIESMRRRAASLGGELSLSAGAEGGTRATLRFRSRPRNA